MEQVQLTGTALTGIDHPATRGLIATAPQTVMLGRRAPKGTPRCLKLKNYLRRDYRLPTLPVDWTKKAMSALSQMYLNDRYGCCVISDAFHRVGVWTGNDTGQAVIGADTEVLQTYRIWNPGTRDDGCVITEVLDHCRDKGITVAGQNHKIDGYVAIDNTDWDEVLVALYLFGTIPLGIDLPQAWTQNAIWDVTTTRVVGGHDVPAVAMLSPNGIRISSWGRIYEITKAAFTSRKWVKEAYAVLSPDWYGLDKVAAGNLIDATTLKADLLKLASGEVPDIGPSPPAPVPPAPVPPAPTPPGGFDVFDLIRKIRDTIAALRQFSTDHDYLALIQKLLTIWGISVTLEEPHKAAMAKAPKLTPEDATKLADALDAACPAPAKGAATASASLGFDWLSKLMPVLIDLLSKIFK